MYLVSGLGFMSGLGDLGLVEGSRFVVIRH